MAKRINQNKSTYALYGPEELLFRPIEHILEALNKDQLAEIWGVNKGTATNMKMRPWEYKGTTMEVTPERERQVRQWLERQVREM
jgi:hypothetical protein